MKNKHYWAIAIIILVLLGGYWLLTQNKQAGAPENSDIPGLEGQENFESQDQTSENGQSTATNQLPTSTSALAISTQIAGGSITIDNFYLDEPGFIVIHQLNNDGSLGAIIGKSGYLGQGSGQDLLITAKVSAEQQYTGVIYKDNGDKSFNSNSDNPVLQPTGKPIMNNFQVGN
ncbi:MAG: hypothetical protein R3B41_03180 [Candidatus Doudnabacteria bacterium]